MAEAAEKPPTTTLPRLRSDLRLEPAGCDARGFVKLVITDPVRGTYYQMEWPLSAAMLGWSQADTVEGLISQTYDGAGADLSVSDITSLAQFLVTHQLTEMDEDGSWRRYAHKARAGRHGMLMGLMHSYLFFRIPLLHPQSMLTRLLPWFGPVYGIRFWIGMAVLAVIGLHLSLRQWSDVQAGFAAGIQMEGLAIYAGVLLVQKAIHELGHGLTTVRYGCSVPSMGVAIMLGTPVLYTDTSDSWRLPRRGDRLAIVLAGVGAEAIVATLALLAWPFLPDGVCRQICFSIVTSSVVTTVAINLNPFMRFDGYFALSDMLRVPNLQTRAFELALWRLREALFDLRLAPPEALPRRLESTLVVYAWLTAIYRTMLFIGIAVLVYGIGWKLLGIILGIFEIAFFVLLPIFRELQHWWSIRAEIMARPRLRLSACIPLAAVLGLCVPWLTTVEAPAVLHARLDEPIHLPAPAVIRRAEVVEGQGVKLGQTLFVASSPDYDLQLAKARTELLALQARLGRLHASDKERISRIVIERQHKRALERIAAIERLQSQLIISSPIDGRVVDIDPALSIGSWQGTKMPLARVISKDGARARGVVDDADLARIAMAAEATFVPDDISQPTQRMRLVEISAAGTGRLAEPILADRFGGVVPVVIEKGETMLRTGWADVHFLADGAAPRQAVRGVVRVDATSVSPLTLIWRQIARVAIREQGF